MFFDCLKEIGWKKFGIFAAGVAFGTAGVKVLSSKDAKKVYTHGTAAVLRAKECVMKTATTIQENAEDIYAEAMDEYKRTHAGSFNPEDIVFHNMMTEKLLRIKMIYPIA